MRGIIIIILVFRLPGVSSFAQTDTTIFYLNSQAKETSKDSAIAYTKQYKNGDLWHGKTYTIKTGLLAAEGDYADRECTIPVGSFNNYAKDGALENRSVYNDTGKILEKTCFYKSGNKKSHIIYGIDDVKEQKGWDEDGKEIKGYIVEQEAKFKNGAEGWMKYLTKNLNSGVAAESGAPAGNYTVVVSFLVNKEGYITDVKALETSEKCKPCIAEAVNVIRNGPQWEPAIQNNEPVIYRQKQSITFQVLEAPKKGRKNKD